MCSAVTTAPTASAEQLLHAVGQAIRNKDWPAATAGAERLLSLGSDRPDSRLRALQAFLQAGQSQRAAEVALAAHDLWPGAPRLAHLAMLALARAGNRPAALEAGRQALQDDPANLPLAAALADALTQAGRPAEALAALTAAGARDSADPRAWYELARAGWASGQPAEAALVDARRALELEPGNLRAVELASRLLLDLSMPHQALALLEPLAQPQRNPTVALLLAEALLVVGRLEEGLPLAVGLSARMAPSIPVSRRLTSLLWRAGQADAARDVYRQNLHHRRTSLPPTFQAGVAQILRQDRPPGPEIPPQRIDWLWGRLVAAGRAPLQRDAWERELRQVTALDRFILDWMECRPDALADAAALIDGTAAAATRLAKAQTEGRGVFLAAAHVGLLFGSLAALAGTSLPMTFVASVPNLGQAAHDNHLVSTSGQDEAAIGRALYRAIREGKVVSVAIEGAGASAATRFPLFDRMIPVSTFIPRLAWKTGTPSFFPLVVWTGRRARVSLTRLPAPGPFSTVEAYETAWIRAYLKKLESALLGFPGSARAAGGFWASITL